MEPHNTKSLTGALFLACCLRFEAIDEMMPRLNAWAQDGLRLRQHYAASNRSQFGLFALIYGQTALRYDRTIAANIPPQLCVSLAELGYARHYASGGAVDWAGMDAFLNDRNFDSFTIDLADDWPARDERVLDKVAAILTDSKGPQFVMAFLMSTHYGYQYPKDYERHLPVIEQLTGNVRNAEHLIERREQILNRYRNAAAYLDDKVADLLEKLDPSQTIVVVTGDHGESIFDDGVLSHSSRLSEIQTRVPMVIVGPGIPAMNVDQATSHMDLVPTLLHALTGNPVSLKKTSGRSLLVEPPLDRVLLFQLVTRSSPVELLLIDEKRRLRIDMHGDGTLRAVGFVDEQARMQFDDVSPRDAEPWAKGLEEELVRLLGDPDESLLHGQ